MNQRATVTLMSSVKLPPSLRQFDFFAKPLKDFRVQTIPGAIVSILCFAVIIALFCGEFIDFLSPQTRQEIIVDISRNQKLSIAFDISFAHVPCDVISVDTMDVSGDQQTSIRQDIRKMRMDTLGHYIASDVSVPSSTNRSDLSSRKDKDYCGSCYGAETDVVKCCNSCDAVLAAYQSRGWVVGNVQLFAQCLEEGPVSVAKEGCQLIGRIRVNKVAGSFHFAPGRSYTQGHTHVHDLHTFSGDDLDLSHKIAQLRFGDTIPGHKNALDGTNWTSTIKSPMLSYFLKLVPTIYQNRAEELVTTNQYSVTSQARSTPLSGASDGIPGVFFNFEISPLLVKLSVEKKSFLHFLTNTCAIIGGAFTVFGIIDTLLYRSFCFLEKLK